MALFDNEFYPTPDEVLDVMGIDCYGKKCYEPQAGKGNIVNYLMRNGAEQVIAAEKQPELRKILAGTGNCKVIAEDSFDVKPFDISHIQLIIMNPPFSNADKHILHAWKIAPEGCEISALCNWTTVFEDTYVGGNRELKQVIKDYGEAMDLGSCFDQAERKTNVRVALVKLFKPVISEGLDMDGFYLVDDQEVQAEGVIQYNELKAMVNSYVAAVKCFDRLKEVANELSSYTSGMGISGAFNYSVTYNSNVTNKVDFAKDLQKECWKKIFAKMKLEKYVTSGVMKDINKFIESRCNYPFSMRNIRRMFEIIIGTSGDTMNRAIVEAIDNFTKYTDKNRYGVEGWKTNSGYMLNRKFICNGIAEHSIGSGKLRVNDYGHSMDKLKDLIKALCYITGTNYDTIPAMNSVTMLKNEKGEPLKHYRISGDGGITPFEGYEDRFEYKYADFETNKWYDWGFFQFKIFGKGTGHFKFKKEDDWAMLNRAYAKIKGQVLPEGKL